MEKWRDEENKIELGCCTCRLNHTEKNPVTERMRGSLQCVWAQYGYWAAALELKYASACVALCGSLSLCAVWVSNCMHICVIVCVRFCLCLHCKGGCATAAALLFLTPLVLFLPSFPHRVWTADRDILLCAAPVFGDDLWSHR